MRNVFKPSIFLPQQRVPRGCRGVVKGRFRIGGLFEIPTPAGTAAVSHHIIVAHAGTRTGAAQYSRRSNV